MTLSVMAKITASPTSEKGLIVFYSGGFIFVFKQLKMVPDKTAFELFLFYNYLVL